MYLIIHMAIHTKGNFSARLDWVKIKKDLKNYFRPNNYAFKAHYTLYAYI